MRSKYCNCSSSSSSSKINDQESDDGVASINSKDDGDDAGDEMSNIL